MNGGAGIIIFQEPTGGDLCVVEYEVMYINSSQHSSFMGWGSGRRKLRKIEERQPMLQDARKIVFFMPHTSDQPAITPLLSDIREALGKEGVPSETHSVEDMKTTVFSMSLKLSKMRLSKGEREGVERLFRLKDSFARLRIACRILRSEPDALLVEAHALERDYHYGDKLESAAGYCRIPESRILFLRDFLCDYELPIRQGLETMDAGVSGRVRAASEIIGIDELTIGIEAPLLIGTLKSNLRRCLLVRIPAPAADNMEGVKAATDFERRYGFGMSLCNTLEECEVKALALALLGAVRR
jgi:hypothetical protein